MGIKYASGRHAWGHCQRCGLRFKLDQLRSDDYEPGLHVCYDCWDPEHPQERLPDVLDAITLRQPTGDQDKATAKTVPGTVPDACEQPTVSWGFLDGAHEAGATSILLSFTVDIAFGAAVWIKQDDETVEYFTAAGPVEGSRVVHLNRPLPAAVGANAVYFLCGDRYGVDLEPPSFTGAFDGAGEIVEVSLQPTMPCVADSVEYVLTGAPPGITVEDNLDGTFSIITDASTADGGTYNFTVTATYTDSCGNVDVVNFPVEVTLTASFVNLLMAGYKIVGGEEQPTLMQVTNFTEIAGGERSIDTVFEEVGSVNDCIFTDVAVFEDGRIYVSRGSFTNNVAQRPVHVSKDGTSFEKITPATGQSVAAGWFYKLKRRWTKNIQNLMQFLIEGGSPVERITNDITEVGSMNINVGAGEFGEDTYNSPNQTLPAANWFLVNGPAETLGDEWSIVFDIKFSAADLAASTVSRYLFGSLVSTDSAEPGKGWGVYISGAANIGFIGAKGSSRQYIPGSAYGVTDQWQRITISRNGDSITACAATSSTSTLNNDALRDAFDPDISQVYFGRMGSQTASGQVSHPGAINGTSQISNVRFLKGAGHAKHEARFREMPFLPDLNIHPTENSREMVIETPARTATGAYQNSGILDFSIEPECQRTRSATNMAEGDAAFGYLWGGTGTVYRSSAYKGSVSSANNGMLTWVAHWSTAAGQADAPPGASGSIAGCQYVANRAQDRLGLLWSRAGLWHFGWSLDGETLNWQDVGFAGADTATEMAMGEDGTVIAVSGTQAWRCENAMNAASTWEQITLPGMSGNITKVLVYGELYTIIVRGSSDPECQIFTSINKGATWALFTDAGLSGFFPFGADVRLTEV